MPPKSASILDKLQESLAAIFDQAQVSLANHRKNCVALYKLHSQAGTITQPIKNGTAEKLVGERAFGDVFIDMINRVLVVKKGPAAADRIVKFVGSYIKFMNEKVTAEKVKCATLPSSSASAIMSDDDDDTLASRFISRLLKWLFHGFLAKNKNTRYRCVFIVSEMIAHLGEIDEDMYSVLRDNLTDRICDKESLIRAHAVIALSKLVGSEDPSEVQKNEKTILEVLLDVICYDPAAEVRRAALLNVPLTPATLETILSRTRDTDVITRKLVYSAVLQPKLSDPRQLTIAQREQVVKDGLGDREPGVRVAAGKMVASWFDAVHADANATEEELWAGDDGGVMKGCIALLSVFDVVGPGEAVAVDALLSIFVLRPELLDAYLFSDAFWKNLSPESAVLARVFIDHCSDTQNETCLEAASLPVVTAFAFHVQEAYNALLEVLQEMEDAKQQDGEDEDEDESEQREEELAKREIVLGELLRMALKLDYMDEIGRRKVFSVVRDMLAHPELPPGLIERCLDVLKEIMPSERELIRVVVEIVIELRDDDDEHEAEDITVDGSQSDLTQTTFRKERSMRRAKQRSEMTPEECVQADVRDMRCLMLCIGMLERVHGSFDDNSTLEGILADLIIPAVKRKEPAMREKGLVSLGLCCLIAKNMALSSFQLFISQVQAAPEDLKLRVLQIIFDLLIMYDQEFFGRSEDMAKRIVTFLVQTLEVEEASSVQTVLSIGISKLLLSGMVKDPIVLTSLVITYVSPATANNPELRQCLAYFFPMYCYSSPDNQSRMQSVFMATFDLATSIYEERDEDQEMITPYQVGMLMIDWTNPQKAADFTLSKEVVRTVHADLAIDILLALYDSERSDEDQKLLCQLLGHLHIVPGLEQRAVLMLNILLQHHEEQCPFNDTAVEKVFNRFRSRFCKLFAKDLKHSDLHTYLDDEFRQLYAFIGVDAPEPEQTGDDDVQRSSPKPSPRVGGEASAASSTDEDALSSPTPSPRRKKPSRTSSSDNGEQVRSQRQAKAPTPESNEDELSDVETPVPPSVTPKRKGIKRLFTPGSKHSLASPDIRKRNRTISPQKQDSDESLSGSDSEEERPESPKSDQRHLRPSSGSPQSEDGETSDDDNQVQRVRSSPVGDESSEDVFGYSSD